MANIVPFVPKAGVDAAENVRAFITLARDRLTVFGAHLNFGDDIWDVTDSVHRRGATTQRKRITFCTLETANAKTKDALRSPLREFAKAYIRFKQGVAPVTGQQNRLSALRALEAALAENGVAPDITEIRSDTLDRAAQFVKEHFAVGTAYRIGGQLEEIARFLTEHGMVGALVAGWTNPLPRPPDLDRIDVEFHKRREERLPSSAALDALPKIFHLARDPIDRVVTSIAAILMSAPDRSIEVLTLPEDCEVQTRNPDGTEAYGLRWWPAKGAKPTVKWVIPSMAGTVKEAVSRIRETSAEARRVAAWYEKHPNDLFLRPESEHLRGEEFLSATDVQDIIGLPARTSAREWLRQNGVPSHPRGKNVGYRFTDVERAMIRLLPDGFPVFDPDTGLRYSNALMVIPRNLMNAKRSTFRCMIESVTLQHINDGLGSGVRHGKASVFSRFGFMEGSGEPIEVTSHMFRHYLNTLAQAGGLSELDIAKWSGRKDIRQNAAYDHMTADEMLELVRKHVADGFGGASALEKPPEVPVVTRAQLIEMLAPTAHVTDLGICVHDFAALPCQLFLDCVNCNENCYVKGDKVREQNLREKLERDRARLQEARTAEREGVYGANRWVEALARTVVRLESLCEIFDDPTIPDGTVIRLAENGSVSMIRAAIDARDVLEGVSPTTLTGPGDRRMLPSPGVAGGRHG